MHKMQWLKASPWIFFSICVVVLDQYSKHWALSHLQLGQEMPVLPFFNLALRYNTGAAFSFLGEAGGWQIVFLSAVSVVVILFMSLWLLRLDYPNALLACALSLILGGAIGNLIDRLQFAYVIDFFDFHIADWHYATFNVADTAIVMGVILLFLQILNPFSWFQGK